MVNAMNEQERRRKNIRAISGFLYFLSALYLMAGCGIGAILGSGGALRPRQIASVTFIIGLGAFHFALARGLRRFRPWARKTAVVISSIGLLAFPVGTILCAVFLHALIRRWPITNAADTTEPMEATLVLHS